jgi:hypothetical protein
MKQHLIATAIGGLFAMTAVWSMAAMPKAEYDSTKQRVESNYKAAKERCKTLTGNGKDICEAEAKGEQKVALAELEAQYKPSDKHVKEVRVARADAAYDVAKERCDDRTGNDKDVCVKAAKADYERAKADAKAVQKVAEARNDAAETKVNADAKADKKVANAVADANKTKLDAEYKLAVEKCDALSGAQKDACVAQTKARFGK